MVDDFFLVKTISERRKVIGRLAGVHHFFVYDSSHGIYECTKFVRVQYLDVGNKMQVKLVISVNKTLLKK